MQEEWDSVRLMKESIITIPTINLYKYLYRVEGFSIEKVFKERNALIMGLDFTIYWEEKDNPINWEDDNFSYNDFKKHELCYGRKSWELVSALKLPTDFGDDPIVGKENWDNLIAKIKPIANKLPDIADAYYHYYNDEYEVEEDVKKYKRLMNKYQAWYDKTFDEYPTLGYDFSVGYIQEFYNADSKVQECFSNPNLLVKASISY